MRTPNFFIIGAPKCGTTALYSYLKEHPQVYFSALKEPHFFNDDDEGRNFTELGSYLKLFDLASEQHRAIGEASVLYLSSRSAVRRIHEFNPDARLIVMLRHPVDMFFSLHQQNLFSFRENIRDPIKAWTLQQERAAGRRIPRGCRERQTLQYKQMVSLGSHLECLFGVFPREQVQAISFNEFQCDPKMVYDSALSFLGLEPDDRTFFPKENSSKIHRSFLLARCLAFTSFTKTPVFGNCVAHARSRSEIFFWLAVKKTLEYFRELNTKPWKPLVDPVFAAQLNSELAEQVKKVQQLTGLELRSKYQF